MADEPYTLKQGDTYPPLEATLKRNGLALDLTLADQVLILLKKDTLLISGLCSKGADGVAGYDWSPGDTDSVGTYAVEWEITWSPGNVETVPNKGKVQLVIEDDLN